VTLKCAKTYNINKASTIEHIHIYLCEIVSVVSMEQYFKLLCKQLFATKLGYFTKALYNTLAKAYSHQDYSR